ncbi:MAG TPA: HAD-IA family hydrolase [Pyrinomonadaceae bacterium]|jgi:putative hydrolase of the HAD superfamily
MSQTNLLKVAFFDIGNTLVDKQNKWIPGAKELLVALRGRHIRLGLISNTGDLKRDEVLKSLPPDFDLKLFAAELVIFSSEVGIEKPDPAIFKLAIKKAGVKAGLCLFCTETQAHVDAAKAVGMRGALVKEPPDSDINKLLKKLVDAGLVPAH